MRQSMQHVILKVLSGEKIPLGELMAKVEDYLQVLDPAAVRKVKPAYVIKRTLKKLEEQGIVHFTESHGQSMVSLSDEGSIQLRKFSLSRGQQVLPTLWDGKWRMVILDFTTEDNRVRNAVRYILKKAHFYCLKNSVWVSPYNCEPIIRELQYHMGIGSELLFVTAESIDKEVEVELLEHFGIDK